MITTKKVTLTTASPELAEQLSNYEAISVIKDIARRHAVWSNNKTPLIVTENDSDIINSIDTLRIPESKAGRDTFTVWCHKNGFEPGEYSTGQKFDTREESCILCSLVRKKGITDDMSIYNSDTREEDMIIYESKNFIIVPELGSIKTGYLMIVPKKHEWLSVAQIPSRYMPEYMQVCEDIENILKGAFGDSVVTFFEHGSGPSGFSSHKKSIVHAHTHVVHGWTMKKEYLDMVQMKPCPDIQKAANTHYFAYKEGFNGERLCCYDDDVYVQRQFPRQVMAMEMGLAPDLYNWRNTSFSENIHTTLFRIWEFLKTDGGNLPSRVKERTEGFTIPYGERYGYED